VGFSIITISALQIIATPVPASAAPVPVSIAPAPDRAGTAAVGAGSKPAIQGRHCHDHSRPTVPSVVRERPKPLKKGQLTVKMGLQTPIFSQSPRIAMPKRSPKS
jgi:hypothetical protein